MSHESLEFVPDEFLANDPDCPVFGLNLACAYPFPANVADNYNAMASRLAALDDGVYIYPVWETHVTIITFLSFRLHPRPSAEVLASLHACIDPITRLLQTVIDTKAVAPFQLEFHAPVLTRQAAILPVSNPSGEIAQVRKLVGRSLEGDKELHRRLLREGLNVPGIVHSTIMRFKKAPSDSQSFSAGFAAVAVATPSFAISVREFFLTTETKPYMRDGGIVHRFALAGRPSTQKH